MDRAPLSPMWQLLTQQIPVNTWYVQVVLTAFFLNIFLWLLKWAADIGLQNLTDKKENEK